MELRPFASNLGEHITSSDVSGAHRFKFFSNAAALPFQPNSRPKSPLQEVGVHVVSAANQCDKTKYVESGSQTEIYVHVISQEEKDKKQTALREKEIMRRIQFAREERERERQEQEAALPSMTDEKGMKAYRHFLEENETKDFSLREKELDDAIQRKLLTIQEDLKMRYSDEDGQHGNKVLGTDTDGKYKKARCLKGLQKESIKENHSKLSQQKKGFAIEINGLKDFCVEKESRRKHWKCMEQQNRKTEEHARCLDLVESYFNDTH
jgi:hypothetical protein